MRQQSSWLPRLPEGADTPSERLASALAEDILAGRLGSGERLPAHRDLSFRLGIGLGTVTKAYALLERRGLVRSVRGRGTFVAVAQARRVPVIDLSRNVPPAALGDRVLARTLSAIARRVDAAFFNGYPGVTGHEEYRRLMARWFMRFGLDADPARLLLTGGAQHALAVAMSTACGAGGTLFMEAETYAGAIASARHAGIRVRGIEMDGEGMSPGALERALRDHDGSPAAVYVIPTMQNPTTVTMGRGRREAIIRLCRRHDLPIIEDDVYSLEPNPACPQLVTLAPDRVFYVNSLSKTLNPTLRIGGLLVPGPLFDKAAAAVHATGLMVASLSCAVLEQWLIDGTATAIAQSIRKEAETRQDIALSILGDRMRRPGHVGHHIWVPLPDADAQRLDAAAAALGISVTPRAATVARADGLVSGIRLCIGGPSIPELTSALERIAGILDGMAPVSALASAI